MESTSGGKLLIRADGGPHVGIGHLVRCIAVAEEWIRKGNSALICSVEMPAYTKRMFDEAGVIQFQVSADIGSSADAITTADVAHRHRANWVIIDGYSFRREYVSSLRQSGFKILLITDNPDNSNFECDLLLLPGCSFSSTARTRSSAAQLLEGPRFAPLRRTILERRAPLANWDAKIRRVLLLMGGTDPLNLTSRLIAILPHSPGLRYVTVTTSANQHFDSIAKAIAARPENDVDLNVDPADIARLIQNCNFAISAAGSTAWELCALGTPSILCVTADNQEHVAQLFRQSGAAIVLDARDTGFEARVSDMLSNLLESPDRAAAMTSRAIALVDGNGTARIVARLLAAELHLRMVTMEDAECLHAWANDPVTRAASFSEAPITWDTHLTWLRGCLSNAPTRIYLAHARGVAVGVIRFEADPCSGIAKVSVSTSPTARRHGWASALLVRGCEAAWQDLPMITAINAYVRVNNTASLSLFARSEFKDLGAISIGPHAAKRFCLLRS
jgi:UDP-2,4-diacetamido-2,4,6-trideoxy-beta-L-altropyranose hydrolase